MARGTRLVSHLLVQLVAEDRFIACLIQSGVRMTAGSDGGGGATWKYESGVFPPLLRDVRHGSPSGGTGWLRSWHILDSLVMCHESNQPVPPEGLPCLTSLRRGGKTPLSYFHVAPPPPSDPAVIRTPLWMRQAMKRSSATNWTSRWLTNRVPRAIIWRYRGTIRARQSWTRYAPSRLGCSRSRSVRCRPEMG